MTIYIVESHVDSLTAISKPPSDGRSIVFRAELKKEEPKDSRVFQAPTQAEIMRAAAYECERRFRMAKAAAPARPVPSRMMLLGSGVAIAVSVPENDPFAESSGVRI